MMNLAEIKGLFHPVGGITKIMLRMPQLFFTLRSKEMDLRGKNDAT
jgi:hypothetical protein